MRFQFTQSDIQEEISAIAQQLDGLRNKAKMEAEAVRLIDEVEYTKGLMRSHGIDEVILSNWAIALFEAACDQEPGSNSFDIQLLRDRIGGAEALADKYKADYERVQAELSQRLDCDRISHLEEMVESQSRTIQELKDDLAFACTDLDEATEKCNNLAKEIESLESAAEKNERAYIALETSLTLACQDLDAMRENEPLQLASQGKESTEEVQQAQFVEVASAEVAQADTEVIQVEATAEPKEDNLTALLNFGRGDANKARAKMEAITWEQIAIACNHNPLMISKTLEELNTSRSALKKEFYGRIEYLVAKHVLLTCDRAALNLVPMSIKLAAERLMREAQESNTELEDPAKKEDEMDKYENFLCTIARSSVAWNNLTWEKFKEVVDSSEALIALQEAKATKVQKEKRELLLDSKLAQLLSEYVMRTGDRADFDWLPSPIVETAEELTAKVEKNAIAPGTRLNVEGIEWEVINHDIDTDWIDVVCPETKKRQSIHVTELPQATAA
jgi:uncharacterized coiled-coil protein SlyX